MTCLSNLLVPMIAMQNTSRRRSEISRFNSIIFTDLLVYDFTWILSFLQKHKQSTTKYNKKQNKIKNNSGFSTFIRMMRRSFVVSPTIMLQCICWTSKFLLVHMIEFDPQINFRRYATGTCEGSPILFFELHKNDDDDWMIEVCETWRCISVQPSSNKKINRWLCMGVTLKLKD